MEERYIDDLISVIIPVYNCEKHIGKAIDSILGQTYGNFEIVLVDDCSKDDSAEIIKKYSAAHNNVIYHKQETNQGAAVARNTALELAKGRYVAFLDSDDVWLPEKTEKQMRLMEDKEAKISYTAIEMIDEEDKLIKSKRKVKEKVTYKILLRNTVLATSTVIVDRKFFGDFRMPLRRGGQDYATWLQLLRGGVTAYGINEALVRYRVCENSLSSNKFKSVKQVWQIQTVDEKINKFSAFFNVIGFCFHAFIKHFF